MAGQNQTQVIVVGGGIIGAALALYLTRAGAVVRVVEVGQGAATQASFGWINASFYVDEAHHLLRAEAMRAWARLVASLPLDLTTCGALIWDGTEAALQRRYQTLRGHGYLVEWQTADVVAARVPALGQVPEAALWCPTEAVIDGAAAADVMLRAACAAGAQVLRGLSVMALQRAGGRVTGVRTEAGVLEADHVVICAGTGSPALLKGIGALPMAARPALILRSAAQPPLATPVLATPQGDVRQLPGGELLMPAAINHQADDAESLPDSLEAAAAEGLARLQQLFPRQTIRLAEMTVAARPYPADGLPVIGAVAPGASVAVMHSGITLAALTAECLSAEILGHPAPIDTKMLTPYRPQRFSDSTA
ncbi:MAG: FAD-dependent oxidoreductase [Paracoccaceae bacterium]|nr:FAD-dependent oxidoreductase [Paracoccaceae bacterium]